MVFRHLPVKSLQDVTQNFEQLQKGTAISTALPTGPVGDGQTIYYQNAAMAESGVVWTLRYRAASTSAHKWEFVGGAPWVAGPAGDVKTESAAFVIFTGGPSITLPLAGDYATSMLINFVEETVGYRQAQMYLSAVGLVGVGAIDQGAIAQLTNTSFGIITVAATEALTIRVATASANKQRFINGVLSVVPVRVG